MSAAIQSARQVYQALRPLIDDALYRATSTAGTVAGLDPAPFVPVTKFGAVGDGQFVFDASIGLASDVVHSPSGPFKPSDVGKSGDFLGAAAGGAPLVGITITGFLSATDVTVSAPAGTAVASGGTFSWGTDNGPAIQAAILATTGTGKTIWFPGGNYAIATGANLRTGVTFWGSPDVLIMNMLAGTGDFDTASVPFLNAITNANAAALSANAPAGATSVQVAALPTGLTVASRDQPVQLNRNAALTDNGSTYIVRSVTGGGPFTLHLDRATTISYPAATSVVAVVEGQVTDVHFWGNGLRMTGTAGRYFEFFAAMRCTIEGVLFSDMLGQPGSVSGAMWAHFEGMCVDSWYIDCAADGPVNWNVSTGENCGWLRCTATRLGANGLNLVSCISCYVLGPGRVADGTSSNGAVFFQGSAVNAPNIGCGVDEEMLFAGNAAAVNFAYADECFALGDYFGNVSGLGVQATAGANTIGPANVTGNTGDGIVVHQGAGVTTLDTVDISDNALSGLKALGDVVAVGLKSTSGSGTQAFIDAVVNISNAEGGTPKVTLEAADLVQDRGGFVCVQNSGGELRVSDSTVRLGANGVIGIYNGLGVVSALDTDIVLIGAPAGTDAYFLDTNAGTFRSKNLRIGAVPFTVRAGNFLSQGATVQANGAGVVAVAWPDLQPSEMPKLEMVTLPTAGGFAAVGPLLVALTPGTGFSIQSIIGNNAVYQYEI